MRDEIVIVEWYGRAEVGVRAGSVDDASVQDDRNVCSLDTGLRRPLQHADRF